MRTFACLTVLSLFAGCACAQASTETARAARESVKPLVAEAQSARDKTVVLGHTAYQQPGDLGRHRALVTDLNKAAKLVEQRAEGMSARDLALSQYYLREANTTATRIVTLTRGDIQSADVVKLKEAMAPVKKMQTRMQSGQNPFAYRQVTVSVAGANGKPAAQRWRVYVLPAGVMERPEHFDLDTIRELLAELTFQDLTTPSRWTVAQGEMRLWLGPDAAYDAMAQRVLAGQKIAFTPLHPAPANAAELQLSFTTPKDVVQP